MLQKDSIKVRKLVKKKLLIIFGALFLAGLAILLVLFFLKNSGSPGKNNFVSEPGLASRAKELMAQGKLPEAKAVLQKLIMEFSNSRLRSS